MAKAFSENEKAVIKAKLLEGAVECIKKYGVKKTTVDELAACAGISKGAFYILYDIKEKLFFDAVMGNHDKLQQNMLNFINDNRDNLTVETITKIIYTTLKEAQPFWSALFMNGDLDYMYRKLPKEMIEEHFANDLDFGTQFFSALPLKDNSDISIITASLRAVFSTILYVKNIGEEKYDEAVKVLIRGIMVQFLEVK
jgi:AcrR family transcriptional regulator